MKFRATLDIEMPDAIAAALLRDSGAGLTDRGDQLAGLLLGALSPLPATLREFLLAPDRTPILADRPHRLTTKASVTAVDLTLTEPEPAKKVAKRARRKTNQTSKEPRA